MGEMSYMSEPAQTRPRWDAPRREVHCLVSPDGAITAASGPTWPGLDPAALPGRPVAALGTTTDAAALAALVGSTGVVRTRLPADEDRWVEWTAELVDDATVLHGVDVTDTVVQEREAERVHVALRSLLHAVSHDVRAPVRLMSAFAERLVARYAEGLDGRAAEYVAQIGSGAKRANAMLDGLLAYSRALQTEPTPEQVRLASVVAGALTRVDPAGPSATNRIELDADLEVVVDPDVLHQVLHALLDNAVHHGRGRDPDVVVTVRGHHEDGWTVLEVVDDGPGIPPREREKVFAPFHQVDPHASDAGTGVGLTVARAAVEAVGGSLMLASWTQDDDGAHGTSVTVRLPPDRPVEGA